MFPNTLEKLKREALKLKQMLMLSLYIKIKCILLIIENATAATTDTQDIPNIIMTPRFPKIAPIWRPTNVKATPRALNKKISSKMYSLIVKIVITNLIRVGNISTEMQWLVATETTLKPSKMQANISWAAGALMKKEQKHRIPIKTCDTATKCFLLKYHICYLKIYMGFGNKRYLHNRLRPLLNKINWVCRRFSDFATATVSMRQLNNKRVFHTLVVFLIPIIPIIDRQTEAIFSRDNSRLR